MSSVDANAQTSVRHGTHRPGRAPAIIALVALVAAALVFGLVWFHPWAPTNAAAASDGPRDANGKCLPEFVQKDISDKKLSRPVKDGLDASTPAKSRDKLIDAFGHSAKYLREFALQGLAYEPKDVPSAKAMVKDKCLSDEGYKFWTKVKDDLMADAVSFVDNPPAGSFNSGWYNNRIVVAPQSGVGGNAKALKIELTGNRGTIYILLRCGNLTFLKPPPGVPEGPTDHPKDYCPDQPGKQPWGTPCSKVGQRGSISQGNHDENGGKPDETRNQTGQAEDERPVVDDRQDTGSGDSGSGDGSGSGSGDSGSGDEGVNDGTVSTGGSGATCNPEFQNC